MSGLRLVVSISLWAPLACAQSYTISTAVGAGPPSNVAGKSTSLGNGFPSYLTADSAGDVFFVDQNSVIEMNASTNLLTIVAGNGTTGYSGDNGPATAAQLNNPQALAIDSNGTLYIADAGNYVIRKVSGGTITTIAGNGNSSTVCANGAAASVSFNSPGGLAVDSQGNLFIADTGNYCVNELSNGKISVFAGTGQTTAIDGSNLGDNGPATAATFGFPEGIALDTGGNLYIADAGNSRIREVNAITLKIATVAGNGTPSFSGDGGAATEASLLNPLSVAVDSQGDIFISDGNNNVIREVSGGNINTVAGDYALGAGFSGDTGNAAQAQLSAPQAIALDGLGNLYIADQSNNRIREVSGGIITTVVGNGSIGDGGPAADAQLVSPFGLALDTAGNLYIADNQAQLVRKATASSGVITTIAGNGTAGGAIVNGSSATSVGIAFPAAVAADKNGNVYVADTFRFAVLEVTGGLIYNFAGTGTAGYSGDGTAATGAEIGNVYGLAVDSELNVYLSDNFATSDTILNRVRVVSNGIINTYAGNGMIGYSGDGQAATSAELDFPAGLAVDSHGNLYIADVYNNVIRMVSASNGTISTVAGQTGVTLSNPNGVAVDAQGNIFIADTQDNRIVMVSASNGSATVIAGTGVSGFSGDYGPATSAELDSPLDVAVNSTGTVFIADSSGRIRVLTPTTGSACSYSGVPPSLPVAAGGGTPSIAVSTTAFCPWSITALPSWIALSGPSQVTGPGNASLSIAANTGGARTANISIAGTSVTVMQAANGPNLCDINQDGKVNAQDVQLLISQALGKSSLTTDLNLDGVLNVADIQIDIEAVLTGSCLATPPI